MEKHNNELNLVLYPWIDWAYALINENRHTGGNGFRHGFSVLGILIDYKFRRSVLLKSSLVHDLQEDFLDKFPEAEKSAKLEEMRRIDPDGPAVVALMDEVSKKKNEKKEDYLRRLKDYGSKDAKILKVADRIDNVCDTNRDIWSADKIREYLRQTSELVLPMAMEVDKRMYTELKDLIKIKTDIVNSGVYK